MSMMHNTHNGFASQHDEPEKPEEAHSCGVLPLSCAWPIDSNGPIMQVEKTFQESFHNLTINQHADVSSGEKQSEDLHLTDVSQASVIDGSSSVPVSLSTRPTLKINENASRLVIPTFASPRVTVTPLVEVDVEMRHPSDINRYENDDFLEKRFGELTMSSFSKEDNPMPNNIRPATEYSLGQNFGLRLEESGLGDIRVVDFFPMLASLRRLTCFMPPAVAVDHDGNVCFEDMCMMLSLPTSVMKNLRVIYITFATHASGLLTVVNTIASCLKYVSVLILRIPDSQREDEVFVFDMRRTPFRASGVIEVLSAVASYRRSGDLAPILSTYTKKHIYQPLLVEAMIKYQETFRPFLNDNVCRAIIRWSFSSSEMDHRFPHIVSVTKRISRLSPFEEEMLDMYPKIQCLTYNSNTLPVSGFTHPLLSFIYWKPGNRVSENVCFAGVPNLQYLEMVGGVSGRFEGTLSLAKNERLRFLTLQQIKGLKIDMGKESHRLDVLHLVRCRDLAWRFSDLKIRQLDCRGPPPDNLLLILMIKAKKAHSLARRRMDYNPGSPCSFTSIENLFLMPYLLPEGELLYRCPFVSSKMPYMLKSLELEKCRISISPVLFPVLCSLKVKDCEVSFMVKRPGKTRQSTPEPPFLMLKTLDMELGMMRVDVSTLVKSRKHRFPQEFKYYLNAPKLEKLRLWDVEDQSKFSIDRSSCPLLKSFKWRGTRYSTLPFDFRSARGPLFPKLYELTLSKTQNSAVDSGQLCHLLGLSYVSVLCLLDYANITNQGSMYLRCKFAKYSNNVYQTAWKSVFECKFHLDKKSMPEVEKALLRNMPFCEIFIANDVMKSNVNKSALI